jgi:TolB protein
LVSSLKDGTGQRLTYLPGTQLMPAVSWQRDKVAFISDVTGNPDLFVQPFSPETGAQGKPQQVFSAKQATQGSPCFSPDGKKLAFVSNKDGSPRIYVISIPQPGASLKNIKANLITKRNRENSAPSWSPDGKKIAYCARSQGERQIWVYDFTTNEERQLTEGAGNKENPSWAPDSLHLVFNSSDTNHSELFLINLNQAESIQITGGPGEKRFPNWEPRSIQ